MKNSQLEMINRLENNIKHAELKTVIDDDSTVCLINDIDMAVSLIKEQNEKISKALDMAFQYGQIDGGHHKMWVIDQMIRALTGEKYNEWIEDYIYDKETGDTYIWDKGIVP